MSAFAEWLSGVSQEHANEVLVIQLRHCRIDQPAALVDRFRLEPGKDANDLANDIEERAREDAAVMQTAQVYAALAYVGEEQVAMRRFRVAAPAMQDDALGLSEPASSVGVISQLMRHLEATQGLMFRFVQGSQTMNLRDLERAGKRIESLEDRNEKLRLLDEKRAGKRAKREQKALLNKAKAEGLGKLANAALMLAPVAAGAALGEKKSKSNKLDDASFAAMIESIDDEQKQKLFSILRPEQLAVFAAMAKKYGDSFNVGSSDDDDDDDDDE